VFLQGAVASGTLFRFDQAKNRYIPVLRHAQAEVRVAAEHNFQFALVVNDANGEPQVRLFAARSVFVLPD
jgi:hypothetical protein